MNVVIHQCAFCDAEHVDVTAIARGLYACPDCAKVHNEGRKGRAANIGRLKDKPITDPAWGRFFESRKQ